VQGVREDEHAGARIATERKLRGMTQSALAERARVSVSLLRKVEQGSRPATTPFLAALSAAMGIERSTLTGQPYRTGNRRQDAVHDMVGELRRELMMYRLPPQHDEPTPTLAELRGAVRAVSESRHSVDLDALGSRLPATLAALRSASHSYSGSDREQVMALLAEAYYAARQFLSKLGYGDLAAVVSDRYEWAAEQSGDQLAFALAAVLRAGDLDGAADWQGGRALMDGTLAWLDEGLRSPAALSVRGYLHLTAAYVAAHAGDEPGVWAHHAEAAELATRVGPGRDDYRLYFGPTNVAIWGTALGVELMDGAAAVHRAKLVQLTPQTPPERAGHHYLDLARGQLLYGDRAGSLTSLLTARQIAPAQTRYHPLARETVYALGRAERRSTDTLRGLAAWMGIQD
jgi:transcriptional regulator with XRE-family HTH domain